MLNFLYCCDQNYNLQFQTSLFSLLENINEQINVFVLHKENFQKDKISVKITEHKYINKIFFQQFSSKVEEFPNIQDSHVSEATYYRLFIDEHFKEEVDFFIYLDADIVCIENPISQIKEHIKLLKSSKNIICVRTENSIKDSRLRLDMKSSKYFNAGVMVIDYQKWKELKVGLNLREDLKNNTKKLDFWDQDLLNIYFDGNYIELHKDLNSRVHLENSKNTVIKERKKENQKLKNEKFTNKKLLHFAGKYKPWSLKGILNKDTKPYHQNFQDIFENSIHLQFNWKGNLLRDFIYSILTLKIFLYKNPLKLINKVLISLLIKNENF